MEHVRDKIGRKRTENIYVIKNKLPFSAKKMNSEDLYFNLNWISILHQAELAESSVHTNQDVECNVEFQGKSLHF